MHWLWLAGLLAAAVGAEAPAAVETSRVVWRFGGTENWTVWWPADRGAPPFECLRDGDAATLAIQRTPEALSLPYFEPNLKGTVVLHKAIGFGLTVELPAGEGLELSPMLIDATSELLVLRPMPLRPGLNTLDWRIPEDIVTSYSYQGSPVDRRPDGDLKLWEISILKPADTPAARLRFTEGRCTERQPLIDLLTVTVETGHPVNLVLLPEARETPEMVVRNRWTDEVTCELVTTLSTPRRPGEPVTRAITVPAAGELRLPIDDPSTDQGVRWVDSELRAGADVAMSRGAYAKLRPNPSRPGRKQGFLFSICTHASWWAPETREREFLAMETVGCEIVRDGPGWAQIEGGRRGVYDWAPMDSMIDLADRHNLELQGNFGSIPRWAAPEEAAASDNFLDYIFHAPRRGWSEFEAFAFALVDRYKHKIRYWEMGNEPDLEFFWKGTTDEYIRMLRIAYEQGKRADPNALIMTGGFSGIGPHDGKKLNPTMQERVLAEAQDSFDIHAFHQHGPFEYFQRIVDVELPRLRAVLRTPKPLYFNETAMYSSDIGEWAQADLLFRKLLLTWSRGSIGYTWYDLRNDGSDPREPEHNFGLITHDFQPKAAYVAFGALTTILGDKTHAERLDVGADTYVDRFAGPADHVITGWVEKDTEPDRLIALRVAPGTAAFTADLMGNQTPVATADDTVVWPVTHESRYLILRGPTAPALVGQPIVPPAKVTATTGEPAILRCEVTNPLTKPVRLVIRWVPPACLTARAATTTSLELGPSQTAAVELPVLPGRRPGDVPYDQAIRVPLSYEFVGTPWRGALALPVIMPLIADAGALAAAEPLFAPRRIEQVTNVFANDPGNAQHAWKGPDDLSADVWLGRDRDDLVIRVRARDDRHSQPNPAADMWKSDCVQLAFQAPDQPSQWELGVARADDGRTLVHTWLLPAGATDPTAAIVATTNPVDGGIEYVLRLPLAAFGLTAESLAAGIRFNLIVNDADLGPREGWIAIAPGLGDRKEPAVYPVVRVR